MSKINILDSSVYNLISAGEVVERPASVVKELVENSIDAGSKNINIEIKNGGISYIQVSDDGCGIYEDDIKSAFLPHATSKIKNATDLDSILTLGFRGEALASIAAVSKVKLVSKTEDSEMGSSIYIEGGKFEKEEKCSSKTGTTITVSDLFFCVPARAKFLKKPKSEEQEITNIITRIILANPKVNITYIVDGKKQLSSLGSTEKEAMFSIYGKEAINETLEIKAEREGVKVYGFVGKPTYSKSNRTYQTLIINGRYVVNLTVQTAVSNAYGDFLMKRQYPFFIIYLNLPANELDVNVHPNKLDVKFLKPNLIYSVIFEAVSRALNDMDYIKEIDLDSTSPASSKVISAPVSSSQKIDKAGVNLNPFSISSSSLDSANTKELQDTIIENMLENGKNTEGVKDNFGLGSKLLERITEKIKSNREDAYEPEGYYKGDELPKQRDDEFEKFKKEKLMQNDFAEDEIKLIGKIFNTYLIIEWGNNMYLIDQHAGHERLRYDKLKAEYENGDIVVQPMLFPYVLTLNSEDDQILRANLDAIRSVGFDIDEFGDKTYKISSVPVIVSDIDFNKFFGMFLEDKLNKSKLTEAELVKDSLMQMACKSAVKGGDDLSKQEVNLLLSQMGNNNVVLFCPHGRPVVVKITKSEIEKWFKRIV